MELTLDKFRAAAVVFAAITLPVSPAVAQTYDSTSPVAVPVAGNIERLRIVPVVSATYDDNVLRLSDERATGRDDNVRISPAVAIGLNRLFGRVRVAIGGTAGYDFNTRFKGLDRERISLAGSLRGPVGASCTVGAAARFERSQFDLADTTELVSATYQRQTYDLSADCVRSAGLFPLVGATYTLTSNSERSAYNSNQFDLRAGVGYAKPSLGSLQLLGIFSRIRRPDIEELLGVHDSTRISQAELIFSRSVAPRIGFRLGVGILHASPTRASVPPFTGLAFDGEVTIRPVPRLTITPSARRSVDNQSSYSATYTITDLYRVAVAYQLTGRSGVALYAQSLHRDPRGEGLLQLGPRRGEDTLRQIGASYSFDFHKSLRLSLGVSHRERNAENDFYDFDGNSVTASIQARF